MAIALVPAYVYADDVFIITDLGNMFPASEAGDQTEENEGNAADLRALHSFFAQNSLLVSEEFDQELLFIQSPQGGSVHMPSPYINVSHGVDTPPGLGLGGNNDEFDLTSGTAPVLAIVKSSEPAVSMDVSQFFEPKTLVKAGNDYDLNTRGNSKNILADVPYREVEWADRSLGVHKRGDRDFIINTARAPAPSGTVIFDVQNLDLDGATLHVDYSFRSKVLPVASPYDLMDLEYNNIGYLIHRDNSFDGRVNVLTGSTSISGLHPHYTYQLNTTLYDSTPDDPPWYRWIVWNEREIYDIRGTILSTDRYHRANGLIDSWPHQMVVEDGYNKVVSDSIKSHIPVMTDSNKMERTSWDNFKSGRDHTAKAQRSSIVSSHIESIGYELRDDLPAKSILPDITKRGKAELNNDVEYIVVDQYSHASVTILRATGPADPVRENFLNINIPNRNNLLNTPWTITANNTVMAAGIITGNGGSSLFEGLTDDRKAVMFNHYMADRDLDWKLNLYTESIIVESGLDPESGGMVVLDERNDRRYDNSTVLTGMTAPDNVLNGNEILTPILYAKLPFNGEITIDDVHLGNHRSGAPDMSLSHLAGGFGIGDDMYVPFITGYQTVFLTVGDHVLLFDYADISSSYTSSVFTDLEPIRFTKIVPHNVAEGEIETSLSNFVVARNEQKIPATFTLELDAELELRNEISAVTKQSDERNSNKRPLRLPPPPPPWDPLTVTIQTFVNGDHVADKEIHFDDRPIAFTDRGQDIHQSTSTRPYEQVVYNIARYTYEDAFISGSTAVQAKEGDLVEFRVLIGIHGLTEVIPNNAQSTETTTITDSAIISGYISIADASIQVG